MRRLFVEAGGPRLTEPLYGIVYYIVLNYRPSNDADSDNISKPVWDALNGVAYDDDKLVRLRIAGVVEAGISVQGAPAYGDLDTRSLAEEVGIVLDTLFAAGERHILYVELGPLRASMFRFGLALAR